MKQKKADNVYYFFNGKCINMIRAWNEISHKMVAIGDLSGESLIKKDTTEVASNKARVSLFVAPLFM